jgi:DNA-binding IclR family transcriptional regulator
LDTQALLAHDHRAAILERLRARPGLTIGEISRALDVDYKTAVHHLRKLAKGGHVVIAADGRTRPCYLPGAARSRPATPRVLAALAAVRRGAGTPADLGRALGLPRGTAGSLLDRLERRGFVERDLDGYRLTGVALAALPNEAFSSEAGIAPRWMPTSSGG